MTSNATLTQREKGFRFCNRMALYVPVRLMQELLREYRSQVESLAVSLSFDDKALRTHENELVASADERRCEFGGMVEIRHFDDGTRYWDCPRCGDSHEEHE